MSVRTLTALDFIWGVSKRTPCCLVNGNTVALGRPRHSEICVSLGVGEGEALLDLARAVGRSGGVYVVEMSKDVLNTARCHLEKANLHNVDYIHAIYEQIELEDSVADLVVSDCSIAFAQEKSQVWDEIARILKPGGRFVISDIFAEAPLSRRKPVRSRKNICLADLMTKEEYLYQIDGKGFERVTIIEESAPYSADYLDRPVTLCSFVISGRKARARRFDG